MSNLTSCKACAEPIIFLKTKDNKTIPVNFSSVSSVEKEFAAIGKKFPFVYGRHISHFATCTDSDKFRSSSKSQSLFVSKSQCPIPSEVEGSSSHSPLVSQSQSPLLYFIPTTIN
ncbi:MAG: hypothetical protein Q8K40_03610 [Ignavibacteria bacterium]|nr:hypothetical protein [Ignavibacteria bacterium]